MARHAADRLIGFARSLGGARPKKNFDDSGELAIAKFTSENDTMPIERVEVATLRRWNVNYKSLSPRFECSVR